MTPARRFTDEPRRSPALPLLVVGLMLTIDAAAFAALRALLGGA